MAFCGVQAFDKWRAEHVASVLAVRQAVNEGASDAALRPLIEDARGQLWTLFAMKKAVVCSESVLLIMNLEHLLPPVISPLLHSSPHELSCTSIAKQYISQRCRHVKCPTCHLEYRLLGTYFLLRRDMKCLDALQRRGIHCCAIMGAVGSDSLQPCVHLWMRKMGVQHTRLWGWTLAEDVGVTGAGAAVCVGWRPACEHRVQWPPRQAGRHGPRHAAAHEAGGTAGESAVA